MNLHWAWTRGLLGNVTDALLFFRYSPTNRPVGSIFYERVYAAWGFLPTPYRVVCFAAMTANLAVAALWAKKLTRSTTVALLTALLLSFHGWLTQLYMHMGFCFDIFCFLFYYLAFWWYLRDRAEGRIPGLSACAVWALLYALAMGSKEMAVSLPLILLVYELLFHPPTRATWRRWLWREGRMPLLGVLMTLAFIGGRLGAEHALLTHEAYRPHISLEKYLTFCATEFRWLVYEGHWSETAAGRLAAVVALLALAATSRVRALGLVLLLAGVLPVAFINQRGMDAIYVALPGMAILLASTLNDLSRFGERLGWSRLRAAAAVFLLTFALLAWAHVPHRLRREYMRAEADEIDAEAADIRQLGPRLLPGSRVLVLNDGLPESAPWSTGFLVRLLRRDQSLEVRRLDTLPQPFRRYEVESYGVILALVDGHLRQVSTADFRARCLDQPIGCIPPVM